MPTEYRVIVTGGPTAEAKVSVSPDPKKAGDDYRAFKKSFPDSTVELQKRPVMPWETVERTEPQG